MSIHSDARKLARMLEEAEARGIKHRSPDEVWRDDAGTCGCVFGVVSILTDPARRRSVQFAVSVALPSIGKTKKGCAWTKERSTFWGISDASDESTRADMHAFLMATPREAWEEAARP